MPLFRQMVLNGQGKVLGGDRGDCVTVHVVEFSTSAEINSVTFYFTVSYITRV